MGRAPSLLDSADVVARVRGAWGQGPSLLDLADLVARVRGEWGQGPSLLDSGKGESEGKGTTHQAEFILSVYLRRGASA